MISYDQALNILREVATTERKMATEIPTALSLKMVLARDVVGHEDVPMFNNSAMDGFAVCAERTANASSNHPVSFPVYGFLAAGDDASEINEMELKDGAVEIMTGAMMPVAPFNAVVRVEDIELIGMGADRRIILRKPVRAGENVRARGSDFSSGQLVAKAGSLISAAHIMAFASLGIGKLPVFARPRIAIISTGKELKELGEARTLNSQIWNSSGPYLENWLRDFGCEVKNLGTIADCPETFQKLVKQGLDWGADIIISTGAVSMGKHDFVVEAFQEIGADLHFHKVAIRPGKPICFGEFRKLSRRPVFFGLPGNPISTAVGLRFFVEPYLRGISHQLVEAGLLARLCEPVKKPEGLKCFYKAQAKMGPDGMELKVLSGQGSYVVSSLLEANCWAVLSETGASLATGERIEIFPLNGAIDGGIWNG